MRRYLISYDIKSTPARNKAAARLEKLGERLQKSVFVARCTLSQIQKLEDELHEFLQDDDSLLILPMCAHCFAEASIAGAERPLVVFA